MQPGRSGQPPIQPPAYPPPTDQPGPYPPPPSSLVPPPGRPRHTVRNLLIAVVIIGAVAGVVAFALYRSSTLNITVASNHITNIVAYIVTVDGTQVDSGVLGPGQGVDLAVPMSWWSDNCKSHSIVATSTGGGLGPETDSATVILCAGTPASVTLSI